MMVSRRSHLLVVTSLVVLIAAACATTDTDVQVSRWDRIRRSPTPDEQEILVLTREAINRPFQTIGMVQATVARRLDAPIEEMLQSLLVDGARQLGGDALIDVRKKPASRPEWLAPGHSAPGSAQDTASLTAVVIVWTGPATTRPTGALGR
jgi:hypothetical protein